ncbi:hypothetical protein NKR23_g9612 [Pleurostoma richardsiae]|uniref:G domain-containing protein n=1 Tax=Pleurostoma richardsiae TaxID=41990 RepID=A0AA38R495_9PEZI|nr:hypothetical protein NKR23_g9612 [Pleurostoma richardsiae]
MPYLLNPDPILIAVIGVTGAGKSTFINRATGRSDLKVSDGPSSCTEDIDLSSLDVDGKRVVLVDTPGFDDSERTDADILTLMAKWLKTTYDKDTLLSGVILLQQINEIKFKKSESNRTRLFEKICGEDAFNHVIIATTMWDAVRAETLDECERRQQERISTPHIWGEMHRLGAEVVKHDNTQRSALDIIRKLVNKSRVVLALQDDLSKNGGVVANSAAGLFLNQQLGEKLALVEAQLEEMKKDKKGLLDEITELRNTVENLKQQQTLLKTSQPDDEDTRWLTTLAAAASALASVNTSFCAMM